MSFFVPLHFEHADPRELGLVPEADRQLVYDYMKVNAHQAVLARRMLATPRLNLNDYDCSAVIDWIDLAFATEEVHTSRGIGSSVKAMLHGQGYSGMSYVWDLNRQQDHRGTKFIIRVQAATPEKLQCVGAHLRQRFGVRSLFGGDDFAVVGIEISVDFTPRTKVFPRRADLVLARWKMSELLRKHIYVHPVFLNEGDDRPRVTFGPPDSKRTTTRKIVRYRHQGAPHLFALAGGDRLRRRALAPLLVRNHYRPPLDGTFYVGRRGNEAHLRLQDKIADNRNPGAGTLVELPAENRRSRIEVAFQRNNLEEHDFEECDGLVFLSEEPLGRRQPLISVSHLSRFDFDTLRKPAFDFQLPTMAMEFAGSGKRPGREEVEVFVRSGCFGLDSYHRAEVEALTMERARQPHGSRGDKIKPLGRKGRMLAFDQMNKKTKRALRRLERDWSAFRWPSSRPKRGATGAARAISPLAS